MGKIDENEAVISNPIDLIKSVISKLKAEHPKGSHIVFEDGAWAFFKKPTRQVLGLAMTKARTSPLAMVDVLVANCLVDCSGGLDLKSDDDIGYLMGLAERADEIIGTVKAEVKN